MYIIKNAIYVEKPAGYVKCVLHRKGKEYYLVETKVVINELPQNYDVATMGEVIARYGTGAAEDPISGTEPAKEA